MAMTGVIRPGHISLRVLDLEEGINFYKNTLGLVETGRDSQGRVYFKAWDERDHNSVLIREAARMGISRKDTAAMMQMRPDELDGLGVSFPPATTKLLAPGNVLHNLFTYDPADNE